MKFQNLSKSYIIESGKNSVGYYRKYSDGYIEQWGYSTSGSQIVNLPLAYKSSSYNILLTNKTTTWRYSPFPTNITNKSFKVNSDVEPAFWMTLGY